MVAHLGLHFLDDLPGALIQLKRALKPGGLFLASMPVLGTLQDLRTALLDAEELCTGGVSPRISPSPPCRTAPGYCNAPGLLCRWRMPRRSIFYTPTRCICCTSYVLPAKPTRC